MHARLATRLRIRLTLALLRHKGYIETLSFQNGEVTYRVTEAGKAWAARKAGAVA